MQFVGRNNQFLNKTNLFVKTTVIGYYNAIHVFKHFTLCVPNEQKTNTVEPPWLEHLWDHGNSFETWVVRATEG